MSAQNNSNAHRSVKRFLSSKWGEFTVLAALSLFAVLFTVIFYSVRFTDFYFEMTHRNELNFWSASMLYIDFGQFRYIKHFNVGFIAAFFVGLALYIAAAALMAVKGKKNILYSAAAGYNIGLSLVCLVMGALLKILSTGAIVCCILSILFAMTIFAFLILRRNSAVAARADGAVETAQDSENVSPLPPTKRKAYKIVALVCECVALIVMFTVFFIPVYSSKSGATKESYILIKALTSSGYSMHLSIAFIMLFIAFFAVILYFAATVADFFKSDKAFVGKSQRMVSSAAVFTLVFFILGYCSAFYFNLKGKDELAQQTVSTVSYIPFIISVVTLIVHSVFCGRLNVAETSGGKTAKPLKVEPLIGVIAMTAVTFVSLAFNIVKIHVEVPGLYTRDIKLNGYQLLTTYNNLEAGFQAVAFVEFAFLLMSGILLALSVVGFFAKDDGYYKMVKTSAFANFIFVLMLGLFGMYFEIGQKINMENIESVLKSYGLVLPTSYTYEVKSDTIFMLIASAAVLGTMTARGIFGLGTRPASGDEREEPAPKNDKAPLPKIEPRQENHTDATVAAPKVVDFDACPAFTELDGKVGMFREELEERRRSLFNDPTLPELVRFVVDYAKDSRLHLSYSVEDMATFVAGLGASRLAILQGMSGTGKTSLPKIFTEAIMGNCEIIEVESSWRDKNELLGYYNEFSKCFTPKKFTQCLYKARLNPAITTFIVLDEMNLSRIEYYFSDFLSLMENEEDKREIKLLNVKLCRTENGEQIQYSGLTDGHTVKIPSNVWFIGTANRDESTFEISDKVYDRAQTMNFNKRAPKIHSYGEPQPQRFVPYGMLVQLFYDAKENYKFEAEDNALIVKTERLLAPYNISFGNRILKQMEDFVKIYCSCFADKAGAENDAVERILLSKVVSKLETKVVENKEKLAAEFDKLGLKKCGAFVRKLNED